VECKHRVPATDSIQQASWGKQASCWPLCPPVSSLGPALQGLGLYSVNETMLSRQELRKRLTAQSAPVSRARVGVPDKLGSDLVSGRTSRPGPLWDGICLPPGSGHTTGIWWSPEINHY
jgi:hypothetical protein